MFNNKKSGGRYTKYLLLVITNIYFDIYHKFNKIIAYNLNKTFWEDSSVILPFGGGKK